MMHDIETVRLYIMGIIYHSEGRQVKLPSLRELSAKFGLAVSTVKIAFDRMEEEGYVIARHGVGNFTNPKQYFFPNKRVMPLIGIKIARGDAFYYGDQIMKILAELTAQCSRIPCNIRLLTIGCDITEEFEVELQNSHIDALIAVGVNPKLVSFAAGQIPTVNIGAPCPDAPTVTPNGEAAAKALADELCRRFEIPSVLQLDEHLGVRNFGETLRDDSRLRYTRKLNGKNSLPEHLEKLLATGKFDCVITSTPELIREMLDRYERPDALIAMIGDSIYPDTPSCFYLGISRKKQVEIALGWLLEMLNDELAVIPEYVMEFQLCLHQICEQNNKKHQRSYV